MSLKPRIFVFKTTNVDSVCKTTNTMQFVCETTNANEIKYSMVAKITKDQNRLISDRNPQDNLVICDVANAAFKDIMPQMEYPFYSLSKKPDMDIRRYEHNGNWIEFVPSYKGLVTIYDKDILIYAISQITAKFNAGETVTQRVRINSHELLKFTNRGTSGRDYMALSDALERIRGTTIKTNVVTGDEEQTEFFGLIDSAGIKRKNGLNGRLLWCEIKLSDWIFNAIKSNEVLTLNPDYFLLRKPLERRIYELVRKHCGQQKEWSITLELLHKKSGSKGNKRLFKQVIKVLVKNNNLPDYIIQYDENNNTVDFKNREKWWKDKPSQTNCLYLPPSAYEEARKVAPHYDVYYLEQEFHNWWENSGKPAPKNIKAAFIGFCKKIHQRRPYP